jgi:hypothetical protein
MATPQAYDRSACRGIEVGLEVAGPRSLVRLRGRQEEPPRSRGRWRRLPLAISDAPQLFGHSLSTTH